jgi:hypothetical protein
MSELLFKRRYRLLLAHPIVGDFARAQPNAIEITGLRCQFKITKTLKKTPNTCEITVTNLSRLLRQSLAAKDLRVILEGGYDDHVAGLFVGDCRTLDHARVGADWETRVRCGDGERAMNLGRANASFAPGTPYADILSTVTKPLGLAPDAGITKLMGGQKFESGYAAYGRAADVLDQVTSAAGLEWSIQDGKLQVLRPKGHTTEDALVLSAGTGLLGSPEFNAPDQKTGVAALKVKCLLSARVRCGGRIVLDSIAHKGTFRVVKVTHTGDSHSGNWETEAECQAV